VSHYLRLSHPRLHPAKRWLLGLAAIGGVDLS
jgi:hypothetical protein